MLYHYKRFMREWLSGRASASQADGREFESRFPLQSKIRLSNRKRIRNLLFLILFLFSALFSFRSYPRMSEFRDARSLLAIPSLRSLRISFPAPVIISPVESQKDQKPLVSNSFSFLCSLLLSLLSSNVRITWRSLFARYSVASLLPNLLSRSCHNFACRIAKELETSCF